MLQTKQTISEQSYIIRYKLCYVSILNTQYMTNPTIVYPVKMELGEILAFLA